VKAYLKNSHVDFIEQIRDLLDFIQDDRLGFRPFAHQGKALFP